MDNISINDILNLVNDYSEEELNKIKKAYEYASNLHSHQFRDSNEPYIIHPLNVAYILASIHADSDTICAGLLHDIIEDTNITALDLLELGIDKEIVETVFMVTKPLKEKTELSEEERLQSYNEEIDSIIGSGNSHALRLKVRDMKNNYDPKRLELLQSEKREWLDKKYGNNLRKLEKVLESRNKNDRY